MPGAGNGGTERRVADEELVRLLAEQFPEWARLKLRRLEPGGSDHVIHRLGDTMAVRLPRGDWAAGQARKEARWLPHIAASLPLATPVPLALGMPSSGCPWHWSVTRWLEGATPTAEGIAAGPPGGQAPGGAAEAPRMAGEPTHEAGGITDRRGAALELARYLRALHRLPAADRLIPGPHPDLVSAPLAARDGATRAAIAAVGDSFGDVFGADAMTEVWESALAAPPWERDHEPVWCHGDLHTGNLLAAGGRLTAVIDFGGLCVGDPAADLVIAFTFMSSGSRAVFRAELGLDEDTWRRGRGWALATGLNAYVHYAATEPRVARQTRRQITEALAESAAAG
ncbi:aminoglycoside phosphotransferase family protein [Streptomyces sp. 8L]|uniref:aminoglycoside phosphotransferase family protein n=1 Tax=Streptomyces sp. 8L TaxID=2877242 RepID=UPI003F8DCF6F